MFQYFAIIAGLNIIIFFIIFGLFLVICDHFWKFYFVGDKPAVIFFAITIVIISILSPYITHNLFEVKYPQKTIDITTQIYNNNEELKELTLQINLLKKSLDNPKELTLKQIEDVLSNSLDYSEKMKIFLSQNDSIFSLLKDEIEIERQNAEKSRQIAENLKKLTKEQIETVKFIITEDAKEVSKSSFIDGILLSFPIGFLMSFLASFVFRKLVGKMKNRKQIEDNSVESYNRQK